MMVDSKPSISKPTPEKCIRSFEFWPQNLISLGVVKMQYWKM